MAEIVQVAILGRNEIIREGLKRILLDQGFAVNDPVSAVSEIDLPECRNCIVLVDANSFEEGFASCLEIRQRFPTCRNVLMVDEYSMENVAKAFGAGAIDGYIVKAISCEPLGGALRLIAMGEKVLPSQVADSLNNPMPQHQGESWDNGATGLNLSAREVEILRCLVEGNPNKIISRRLKIADATVKVHIKAILRKLRVRNRTQAAIWAVNRGMSASA